MLGGIIQLKTGVTEGRKKLHTEDLHDLYSSSDVVMIIKEDKTGGMCSIYGREEKCLQAYGRNT
jgi:hypothetical protein